MKKLIKENIKLIAVVVINTIIVGGISVYATSAAKDISFKSNSATFMADNVEDAMNELYSEAQQKKNYYSEEEIVIGTWIDGKPIYRKTLVGDTIPEDQSVLISNVDTVVDAYGEMYFYTGTWYHFPYSTTYRWVLNNNNIVARVQADGNTTKYIWTFEYTKINNESNS